MSKFNEYLKSLEKDHQVTFWSKNVTNEAKDKKIEPKYDINKHPFSWKAYDDDNILYFEGTAKSIEAIENIAKHLGNYGIVNINIYDRKTNKKIDGIG